MSANVSFQMVNEQGWSRGFSNILRYENSRWWRTRRLWINIVIWLLLVNGMLLAVLTTSDETASMPLNELIFESLVVFGVTAGQFAAVGTIIAMQGVIIDEKKSGTAAWIMSKPASRTAFVVAKLVANTVGLFFVILVVQGILAYLQFYVHTGTALPLGSFIGGIALLGLHMLFYLSLTLMLGTIFHERGPVLAIPIAILFGAMFVSGFLGRLVELLPWMIVPGGNSSGLVIEVMTGQSLTTTTPLIATMIWIVVFISIAIWRFGREEF